MITSDLVQIGVKGLPVPLCAIRHQLAVTVPVFVEKENHQSIKLKYFIFESRVGLNGFMKC